MYANNNYICDVTYVNICNVTILGTVVQMCIESKGELLIYSEPNIGYDGFHREVSGNHSLS